MQEPTAKTDDDVDDDDDDDDDDISGSDLDVSSASTDISNDKCDDTVKKVFIKWIAPGGSAHQAGLMEGDEVINLNNSAVYGKQVSSIENLLQDSESLAVDVVENTAKGKNQRSHAYQGNGYQVRVLRHDSHGDTSDESSDNDVNRINPTDHYFIVSYGKTSQTTDHKSSFLRPTSYSDDEPQMESKSVCVSERSKLGNEISTRPSSHDGFNDVSRRVSGKRFGLTNSTSSSVLVESLDSVPKSDFQTRVTITTATYSTLAEPQSLKSGVNWEKDLSCVRSRNDGLMLSQKNGNIWELRVPQASLDRPRSPSPAQRRESYLMATEGVSSLSLGNWAPSSILPEESDGGLSPVDDENSVLELERENSNETHTTLLRVQRNNSIDDDDDDDGVDHSAEILPEQKRHSLKRKYSVGVIEVDKEGFLMRKYNASPGRRSWRQVYVVLKSHVLYIYKDKPLELTIQSSQDEKPISIKSCIVDIAYDYRKRENVFKLTTYNSNQYLFQAKDKDSMMSWIEMIQKNNDPDEDKLGRFKEELIVRQKKSMDIDMSSNQINTKALQPASQKKPSLKKSLSFKSNSGNQSSFKLKKGIDGESGKATWHSKVVNKVKKIGNPASNPIPNYQIPVYSQTVPLERCPMSKTNPSLPLLVQHCCQVVECRALESVGIYRVPGNSANVTALEEELNSKNPDEIDFSDQKWNDANNMGSLLKNFLRKLPEGLVTAELYSRFIDANRKGGEDRMWSLKNLIQQLPLVYGETLRFLIRHLKNVSEHSDKNKMEVRNLAIVFGPTIIRTGEDNMTTMVNDMSDRFRIVESFINNVDWYFESEPVGDLVSPTSPPVEELSPLFVSNHAMSSIEQAAITYESDLSWKSKTGSIKLPSFKKSKRAHSSESSKKHDHCSDRATSPDLGDSGKMSPVYLFPNGVRYGDNSQPSSPSFGRRKFIKRHHSSTNISTTEIHDDFDRSKSEGEEEDLVFYPKPSHATKAYSYARPPPPSYRESRSKGSLPSFGNVAPQPFSKESSVSSENADFNSLSEETKRRLLSFTLRNVVEKKKLGDANVTVARQNEMAENFGKDSSLTVAVPAARKLSSCSQSASATSDEQAVVAEQQLKPSEAKQMFERRSSDAQNSSVKTFPCGAVRLRDGCSSGSSSRNFKIYSKGDVTFGQCQPHEINEWMRDLAFSPKAANERGRARAKTEDLSKGLRRSSSVTRTSFCQDEEEIVMKRRSLSCQDINIGDEDILNRASTFSKSSDSTETSDEEGDPLSSSSKTFDEKLLGLMQECKLDSKSKTDVGQAKKTSHHSRPSSYRASKNVVDKMKAIDPSSNIQSGAVRSIKSLFESGAAHQQVVKSRSSSISSTSSGSILSLDTQRKSSSTIAESDVKRRVWESDSASGDFGYKKQWKEPVWIARERALRNVNSGCESSFKEQPDSNNNLPRGRKSESGLRPQYSRSFSLPVKDSDCFAKDVIIEQKMPHDDTSVARKDSTDDKRPPGGSPVIRRAAVKTMPTMRKVIPVSSVQYEVKPITRPHNQWDGLTHEVTLHKSLTPSEIPSVVLAVPSRAISSTNEPETCNSSSEISMSQDTTADDAWQEKKPTARSRRRFTSDTSAVVQPSFRQTGRTFTAPILGTKVTTATAFELAGFAINPDNINRNPKTRCVRRSERQDKATARENRDGKSVSNIPTSSVISRPYLPVPDNLLPPNYGSPSIRRKGTSLAVPDIDDAKRLSTDRSKLEQNALHIKELIDEMNTEHSLKMERQKSDSISMEAQKSARDRAFRRRRSLGHDRNNGIVVASCISSSGVMADRNRAKTKPTLTTTNDLPRNISSVEWVGVSG